MGKAKDKETLYQELSKAGNVTKKHAGEALSAYAVRLCDSLAKLDDDAFNKISEKGRTWFDNCVDPINTANWKALPKLDGFPEDVAGDVDCPTPKKEAAAAKKTAAKPAEKKETKKPAGKKELKKPAAKPAEKKETKKPVEKVAKKKPMATLIRELIVHRPAITYAEVCDKLDLPAGPGKFSYLAYHYAAEAIKAYIEKTTKK